MQKTTLLSTAAPSSVIVLADRRRKRRVARKHRDVAVRSLVALWFGVGLLAALLIPAVLLSLALRHGAPGMGIALAITTAVAWPLATRWLAKGRPMRLPMRLPTRSRAR
jgi:hypothetical protein